MGRGNPDFEALCACYVGAGPGLVVLYGWLRRDGGGLVVLYGWYVGTVSWRLAM